MAEKFASTKQAIALCDICGFEYKLHSLKNVFVKGRNTNIKACHSCWDPDHPQLRLGEFPVDDAQAIRDPRPDQSLGAGGPDSSLDIQWGWNPVGGGQDPYNLTPNQLLATGKIGQVTISLG